MVGRRCSQGTVILDAQTCLGCVTALVPTEGDFVQEHRISPSRVRAQGHTARGCVPVTLGALSCPRASRQHLEPPATQQTCSPEADYKCFNSSNVSIRPWSWNYRSCWHQTCPPVVTHHCVWIASIPSPAGKDASRIAAVRRCLTR